MKKEIKNLTIDIKNIDVDNEKNIAIVKGILNKANVVDLGNDMTIAGSFTNTIKNSPIVPLILDHKLQVESSIGLQKLNEESDGSLGTTMEINLNIDLGKTAFELIKQFKEAGRPMQMSMGFFIISADFKIIDEEHIRVLKEVEVLEGSLVLYGMNPHSEVKTKEHESKIKKLKTIIEIERRR